MGKRPRRFCTHFHRGYVRTPTRRVLKQPVLFQVPSSLIKTPGGGSGGIGGGTGTGTDSQSLGEPPLARQCREQGVAMISSSGASLGGFAADEWAYRGVPSGSNAEGLSLESRRVCLLVRKCVFCVRRVRWCSMSTSNYIE